MTMDTFWLLLAIEVVVAAFLFVFTWWLSVHYDNYSLVDITWSYSFTLLAVISMVWGGGDKLRSGLMLGMVAIWSLRLGTHILVRVVSHHPKEDVRYKVLRNKWPQDTAVHFLLFFLIQAASVVAMSTPSLLVMRDRASGVTALEWIGLVIWLVGVLGEATADAQMKRFKNNPANQGKVCNAGLWKYSRHPNYFFESVVWWGFFFYAGASPWGWTTVYAPLLMLYFLLCVTGIPLTERCSLQTRGEAYSEYQRTTSVFIPLPPRRAS